MSGKYQFAIHPIDGYLISSMHCEIDPESYQGLAFYQFVPVFNSWTMHYSKNICIPKELIGTNPTGTYHDWYCGWFPDNPSSWCAVIFGLFNKHEYSDFLEPPEMADLVEQALKHLF
ncbi:hypothetical protein NIES4101_31040 [Calothrix sp. NIES-4101]|nr:hypothetical protein NIES4101_31040 [Calothrix sp. NIES-4101]